MPIDKPTLILTKYYLSGLIRNRARLLDIFVWPIIEIFSFGLLSLSLGSDTPSGNLLIISLLGSIIFWHFLYRVSNEITQQLFDDIYGHNFQNIIASPIGEKGFLSALIYGSLLKLALSLFVILPAGYLLYRFNIYSFGLISLIAFIFLVMFGLSLGILISSLVFIFGQRVIVASWAFPILFQPLSCVFYPRESLPWLLKILSYAVPSSYYFEFLRDQISSQRIFASSLLLSGIITTTYFLASLFFFRICLSWSRKTGLLAKL